MEFLLQTAGSLFPKAGSQLQEVAVGQSGGRRKEHPWGDPGWCWALRAGAGAGLYEAVVFTLQLWLLSASMPAKPRRGSALPTLLETQLEVLR